MQAAGSGLEIELVSSTFISNQDETERAASKADASSDTRPDAEPQAGSVAEKAAEDRTRTSAVPPAHTESDPMAQTESMDSDSGDQLRTRSTNASQQKNTLIELLHAKISEHKQYPYLARRQRREGVATIEFVLHPDGSVSGPRLYQSSRTSSLDRAALDAVKSIEPFAPAKTFIDRPEAYRVDVVFNVL
jgi:protein TonB